MTAIAAHLPPDAMIIVGEAYHRFPSRRALIDTTAALDATPAAYCMLRTFFKAFALGGFRVGYGIARDAGMIDCLNLVHPQFGFMYLGEITAVGAWKAGDHFDAVVSKICDAGERLHDAIVGLRYRVWPSSANFLLVDDPAGDVGNR